MRSIIFSLCSVILFTTTLAAGEPTWKAGAAKIIITPEQPMWMSGYGGRNKPAEGKVHELYAKALVLQDLQGNKMVLISLDLVGIPRDMSVAICNNLKEKYSLPRESIVLACSHTHCGPVVGTNLGSMYFLNAEQQKLVEDYSKVLPKRISRVVGDALGKLEPAKVSWGTGKTDFAVNRRNNPEANVPKIREAGMLKGPVDHDVPVLAVRNAEDKLLAIAFGYACHATVLSFYEWCGDYPGFAMLALEKNHPDAIALFWAGCGADQNPLPRRTVPLAEKYGQQLADAVDKVLQRRLPVLVPHLRAFYKEIPLAFADLPSREKFAQDALGKDKFAAARAKLLLEKIAKEGSLAESYPYPVQVFRLGNSLDWVTLGGEVTVDYSLRLKKEVVPGKTWVMGYANDVMAYIPSLRVLKEGGYEGAGAMVYYGLPTAWSARVEENIVAAVLEGAKVVAEAK